MNHEHYAKALDKLETAQGCLRLQLKQADHYEGILLLQILEQLAKTRQLITQLYQEG